MSYIDPYHNAEPRGQGRQDGVPGRTWPGDGDDARFGARRASAARGGYAEGTRPGPPRYDGSVPSHWPGEPPSRDGPPAGHDGDFSPRHGNGMTGPSGADDAQTNPIGWPPVVIEPAFETAGPEPETAGSGYGLGYDSAVPGPEPVLEPEPPRRRGPGRRRAGRGGRPAGAPVGAEPARPGRAGRNLPMAIAVGLGLGVLILVPLFLYPPAFLVVVAAAAGVGSWEMARAVRKVGANPPLVPLLGGGLLMVGLAWWAGPDALSLALLVTVLAMVVWRLGDDPRGFQGDLTSAVLIVVYVPFLGGFAALLASAPDDGHLRVLVTLVAVVLSDIGGYAAGVTLGRHPMAPTVSPKKSWEGFGGSVLAAAIGSALLLFWLFDVALWWGAVFGLAVSVAAVVGDLAESLIKRDIGVKDMSNLLPGHGGMMDRLDSILFAMPIAYLLMAILLPTG